MSETALAIQTVGKSYPAWGSNLARFASWFGAPVKPPSEFWAVRDVSFSLQRGEALALIGQNGAGKSTLLKMITGTVRPTTGSIGVNGRISAILELGLGFNPEFTGRQNIYQAGGLMAFSREELSRLLPEIEEFAEIGEFFDAPLRVYSSGMQARLAFALATAVRPEVLIVDEVLAVGDMAFQRKCFRRLEEYQKGGTSLLFVSHALDSVVRLCEKALWLDRGAMRKIGPSKEICEAFERESLGFQENADGPVKHGSTDKGGHFDSDFAVREWGQQYGDGDARIEKFWLADAFGRAVNVVPAGEDFSINYVVRFVRGCEDVHFGMMVKTVDGVCVFATHFDAQGYEYASRNFAPGEIIQVQFRSKNNLAPGTYFLNCGTNHLKNGKRVVLHRVIDVDCMRVTPHASRNLTGIVDLHASIAVTKVEAVP